VFFSGKPYTLADEKDRVVGLEPVTKFLLSARFKSWNKLALDAV
jgi:hypothetical protein